MAENTTPILKIEVDDSAFDAYVAKFTQYNEAVEASPAAWGKTDQAVKEVSTSFDSALGDMLKLNSAIVNPQSARAFTEFQKISMVSAKSWHAINKDIEQAGKGMSLMGRLALQLGGGIGIVAGAAAGAAGVIGGVAINAAGSIAEKNKSSRGVGLEIGKEDAFNADFKQFGLSEADLQNTADIQSDIKRWKPLITAGFTQDQIQNTPVDELTAEADKRMSGQYKEWEKQGLPAATLAKSYGYTDMFSTQQLRTGASYSGQDFDDSWKKDRKDAPDMAISRADADKATAAKAALDADLAKNENALNGAMVGLFPLVIKGADAFTKMTTAFLKSDELKKDIDSVVTSFEKIDKGAGWLADKLNSLFPGTKDGDKKHDATIDKGSAAAAAVELYDNFKKSLTPDKDGKRHFDWDHVIGKLTDPNHVSPGATFDYMWNSPDTKTDEEKRERKEQDGKPATDSTNGDYKPGTRRLPGGSDTTSSEFVRDPDRVKHLNELEEQHHFPKGYLAAHEHMESSDGKNNRNPTNPNVLGAFQFDEPTAKRYGVNRFDEFSSMKGAAQLLDDNHKKYGDWERASAAFDGDTHLDQDGKDWLAKAKKETRDQNKYLRDHVADFAPTGPSQKELDAATKVRGSDIADSSSSGGDDSGRSRKPENNPQMAPIVFHVNTISPAGNRTTVSVGGMAQ